MNPSTPARPAPQQLTLLDAREVPLQFRLDVRIRERGLAHVAAIKAQLAARAAQRTDIAPARRAA